MTDTDTLIELRFPRTYAKLQYNVASVRLCITILQNALALMEADPDGGKGDGEEATGPVDRRADSAPSPPQSLICSGCEGPDPRCPHQEKGGHRGLCVTCCETIEEGGVPGPPGVDE